MTCPENIVVTGTPTELAQDGSRELSKWLANRPGARRLVRERCRALLEARRNVLRDKRMTGVKPNQEPRQ